MKKIVSILLVVLLLGTSAYADVQIPADIMDAAVASNDAGSIIRDYLFPMLNEDDSIALLFASELNISNGNPHIRSIDAGGWGERAMFGRLITAGTVEKYIDGNIRPGMSNACLADIVRAETFRLLFCTWRGEGATSFKFVSKPKGKVLDYATGVFVPNKHTIYCIRITHITEYSGATRYAYIACDWKHNRNGYCTATFGIVR